MTPGVVEEELALAEYGTARRSGVLAGERTGPRVDFVAFARAIESNTLLCRKCKIKGAKPKGVAQSGKGKSAGEKKKGK